MSADISPQNSPVVESISQLVSWFQAGEKTSGPLRIGTEVEKLTYDAKSLRPLTYEEGVRPILQGLTRHGWEASPSFEQPTMLRRGRASVTLEPGGQIELSGAPLATLHETAEELDAFLKDLSPEVEGINARVSEVAMRPDFYPDQVAWMPRERHQLMRSYLQDKGRLAHYMMTLTTTIQANLDYVSEEDMAKKVRVATRLSPIVTALFANSPFGPNGLSVGARTERLFGLMLIQRAVVSLKSTSAPSLVTKVTSTGYSIFQCSLCFAMTDIIKSMDSPLGNFLRMAGKMSGRRLRISSCIYRRCSQKFD